MSRPAVLGLDVGGANLKAAHTGGGARTAPFALWKRPADLAGALGEIVRPFPPAGRLAVTMTGELCDCFEDRRQGVCAILDAVEEVAAGRPVRVWGTDGAFASPAEARRAHLRTASANWLAAATFAGRFATRGPALFLDVGSTTTDVVPLLGGRPVPRGRTDAERLEQGELVYKGVGRTPVCALTQGRGAAELFATTRDVYLVLGLADECPDDRDTADGRPATRAHAHARLARMLGADRENSTEEQRLELARQVEARLVECVVEALGRVAAALPGAPGAIVSSGSGELLARRALSAQRAFPACPVVSLRDRLGEAVSTAACAYAVAVLSQEREG
jgi:probable H4MPT-linked C1 transfer pathway protein